MIVKWPHESCQEGSESVNKHNNDDDNNDHSNDNDNKENNIKSIKKKNNKYICKTHKRQRIKT